MAGSKCFDYRLSEAPPSGKRPSWAFVGALAGPVLGILFSFSRIGPSGLVWFEGKGGGTIQTPLGQIIESIVFVVGSWVGVLFALALEAKYRPDARAARPKSDAPKEDLWDRELDG
jgi:hypothetical protein